jgi:hypothetical protein
MPYDTALRHKQNSKAAHFEGFADYAFTELAAAPLIESGVCMRPACHERFDPSRAWQIYCCKACRALDTADLRAWGHKAAVPLLVHRIGKYERHNQAIVDRTRAARRYVTRLQSEMMQDRISQREEAPYG